MDFTESEFAKYENTKYGFIIDYFIAKNINIDVIEFMNKYAKKCNVTDFKDTTVDKSLNNTDYCPKYDRDDDKQMRVKELRDVINRTLVKDIISNADFEAFINEHTERNALATHEILKLSEITFGKLKEQIASKQVKTLYPNISDYVGKFMAIKIKPDDEAKLSELIKKYPYEYIEKMKQDIIRIKLMTIGDFEKTDFEARVKTYVNSKIESHKNSIMCKYDPPHRYDIHKESKQKENTTFTRCTKLPGFAAPGVISEFFEFAPLYNYCKLFYSLAIIGSTQSYMFQKPVFANLYWYKNHGLKSICILLYYTNINYIIDFFKKVEQKRDQSIVRDCKTILQEIPIDIENIKKLYYGNIEDFYSELNHFIGLYLNAYEFMKPYEFAYDPSIRISYIMGILLNYLKNIKQIISEVNLYITKSHPQVLILQDNIPEYIKLLGYEHNPGTLKKNNLFFHFILNRFNRPYKRIKLEGLVFPDCVETGFLALLVYLLSKNGIIDASTVKYKPIKEFFIKYDTIKKINEESTNEEWSVVLSKITDLERKGVYEIKSSISNIIVLLYETFGNTKHVTPSFLRDQIRSTQISYLRMMISLLSKKLNKPFTVVDEDRNMRYYMTINDDFKLEVIDSHTSYSYIIDAEIPTNILYNIYFESSVYCNYYNGFFDTIESHRKTAEIYKCIVRIAQILKHWDENLRYHTLRYNIIHVFNPLYIYLKNAYDTFIEDELSLIVKYNNLVNFKFDSTISKELLLIYFAKGDIISLYDTITYLLDCCFPKDGDIEDTYHEYIIEILKAILNIRVYHINKYVIQSICNKCTTFAKIKYDFFTPYLSNNTNVEADILYLIRTNYVSDKKWESLEESPIHIYLTNNADKPYEDKEQVIRTLVMYLDPSCVTGLGNLWNKDVQIADFLKKYAGESAAEPAAEPAADPAAEPALLTGGRKYRIKSAKKYKFSY